MNRVINLALHMSVRPSFIIHLKQMK